MKNRTVKEQVTGFATTDGAGVHLVRVLGHQTVASYDPFLMLDSFDSRNPQDYIAGFPMHPHRGIETITYLAQGEMSHQDSLGNTDVIRSGEVQWMTAGSGIMHAEMPQPSERMLGVQIWLNLPQKDKMALPAYHPITSAQMPEIPLEGGTLRVISGNYKGHKGFQGRYQAVDFYDICLQKGSVLTLETRHDDVVILFLLEGDAQIEDTHVPVKTAVRTSKGERITLKADREDIQILYLGSQRLDEPVAWGGPIVMNTQEELRQAFSELRNGQFIKHKPN